MKIILNLGCKSDGQIALIVLLVSAVAMTLGLSLSRKTGVETVIDTSEEELKQAFNAAESGIDYYLGTGRIGYTAPDLKSVAKVTISEVGGGSELDFGELTPANKTVLFWLVSHNQNGGIGSTYYDGSSADVCVDDTFDKALKIDYLYRVGGNSYRVTRRGYNFNFAGDDPTVDGFESWQSVPAGCARGVRVTTGSTPLLLAVTPIAGGARIKLKAAGGAMFPVQYEEIAATGETGSGVNRKVKVARKYKVPAFMLEAITALGVVTSE